MQHCGGHTCHLGLRHFDLFEQTEHSTQLDQHDLANYADLLLLKLLHGLLDFDNALGWPCTL